jgi:tetratricopeptide (TPR) repeat protein
MALLTQASNSSESAVGRRSPKFMRLLAFVIMSLLIGAARGILQGYTSSDGISSQINSRVSKLGVVSSAVEVTSQKAQRTRLAISAGDFATASRVTRDVLGQSAMHSWRFSPFGDFIAGIFGESPSDVEPQLDEWVARDTTSALPILLRAQFYYEMGWAKRGNRFAADTAPESMTVFAEDMGKALADVDTAIRLDASNPYSYYLKLRILATHGDMHKFGTAFAEAIGKYPNYYSLYQVALATLQPRWGGTVPAMYAFVDKYAGGAPQLSPLRMLYLSLYRYLLSTASVECNAKGFDQDKTAQCVISFMQKAVEPTLEQNVLGALKLYDHSDKYEFGITIKDILSEMLSVNGGEIFAGAILELAATSMHSDAQLKESNPGHNDYIVDELVALSWHYKNFYDNEMTKYREALVDAKAMAFPSEDERNSALANIYEHLAEAADQLQQYTDEIAFGKAAILLGVTSDARYICHGYFQLKRYADAERACTEALTQSDSGDALFWRGEAYFRSGHQDEAVNDLTKAADSGSYLSPYAAVDMSMIYFNRNDNKGALDVLNRYAFLYDPRRTEKSLVAVAYNNRCYAYMQLGELEKALDDCTHSLQYGSIPDAFQKQQELVKRLASPDKSL